MDIRIIKYFLMVAEEENITKAANRLKISQPPLSKQIKQLEEELGVQLFARDKNKMHLTEAGFLLKNYGQAIVELMDKTIEQIYAIKNGVSGTVSIAALESATTSFLPDWIKAFRDKYDNVMFDLWSGTTDEIMEKLSHGVSDIGIIRSPLDDDDYEYIELVPEPWVVLMRKDNPLANEPGEYIELSMIGQQPLLIPARACRLKEISEWFHKSGEKPNVIMRFNDMINCVALVKKDVAIAICPMSVKYMLSGDELVYKKITAPKVESKTMIIWLKNRYYSQATKEFIKFMKVEGPKYSI